MRSIALWTLAAVLGLSITLQASIAVAQGQTPNPGPRKLTDFVAPDFCLAVVMHPSQMMKSPVGQALLARQAGGMGSAMGAQVAAKFSARIKPEQIRRAVVLLEAAGGGDAGPVPAAAILQFEEDVDSGKILSELCSDLETVTFEGKTYLKSAEAGQNGVPTAFYIPDNRLLLTAPEPMLKKMLAKQSGPRPLLEQLRRADMKSDVIVELIGAPLAKLASPAPAPPPAAQAPPGMMGADMLQEVKTASLTLNLTGPALLHLTVYGAKKDSADKIHAMISMLQMLMAQQVQASKAQLSQEPPSGPAAANPFSALGELLKGLQVTKKADSVVLTVKTPENLPELVKRLVEMAQAMAPGGMPGANPPNASEPANSSPQPQSVSPTP